MGEGPETVVEAIQYADGDGGVLVASYLPGLKECATKNGIIMQEDTVHGSMLIPVREKHHDYFLNFTEAPPTEPPTKRGRNCLHGN